MKNSMRVFVCAIALAASAALAGPTPGDLVVAETSGQFDEIVVAFINEAESAELVCINKLQLLDSRGASAEQLEQVAAAAINKIGARWTKASSKVDKLTSRSIGRLGALLESTVVSQITDLFDARNDALSLINSNGAQSVIDIELALDNLTD